MLNARMTYGQHDDFWPAFWRAMLVKLDTLAIFMAISALVYLFVAWLTAPGHAAVHPHLQDVKTQYQAEMKSREPQSVAQAPSRVATANVARVPAAAKNSASVRWAQAPKKNVAAVRKVNAKSVVKSKSNSNSRAIAEAKRVSEKSRRN